MPDDQVSPEACELITYSAQQFLFPCILMVQLQVKSHMYPDFRKTYVSAIFSANSVMIACTVPSQNLIKRTPH